MKNRMKTILTLLCVLSTTAIGSAATAIWNDNGVDWTTYYRPGDTNMAPTTFDGIPTDGTKTSPLWTLQSSVNSAVTLDEVNQYLNVNTASTGTQAWRIDGGANWNANVAATIEVDLRINSLTSGATVVGGILSGNTNRWSNILFGVHSSGDLTVDSTRITGVAANQFNTIRLTYENMDGVGTPTSKIYVNNSLTPFITSTSFASASLDQIRFGDSSSSDFASGDADWRAVKWVSGSAIAPIPEPTTSVLLLGALGLGMAVLGRRRR